MYFEVRDEAPLRARLSPNVHHVTLDFTIPLTVNKDRLKRAFLILCLHPSLDTTVFPYLEGISFSARFVASYTTFENARRDWSGVVTESWGVTGWQAKALGGLASASAFLGGGQGFGQRLGESECLFLKWRPSEGESWLPQYDLIFKVGQKFFPNVFKLTQSRHMRLRRAQCFQCPMRRLGCLSPVCSFKAILAFAKLRPIIQPFLRAHPMLHHSSPIPQSSFRILSCQRSWQRHVPPPRHHLDLLRRTMSEYSKVFCSKNGTI